MSNELSYFLYIVKLEKDKYFIYPSLAKTQFELFVEAELQYSYLKTYKPLEIIQTIPVATIDPLEINKCVKNNMLFYGIENVRGGTYSEEFLPDYLIKTLETEFELCESLIIKRGNVAREIIDKYGLRQWSMDEINKEKEELQAEFSKYTMEKENLNYFREFTANNAKYKIESSFLSDIEWLREKCESNTQLVDASLCIATRASKYIIENQANIQKYRRIIIICKQVFKLYMEIRESHIESIVSEKNLNKICLHNPEFMFDHLIYSLSYNEKQNNIYKIATKHAIDVCDIFTLLTNTILNHIAELEFDVSTYSHDIEWEFPRKLFFLQKLYGDFYTHEVSSSADE